MKNRVEVDQDPHHFLTDDVLETAVWLLVLAFCITFWIGVAALLL